MNKKYNLTRTQMGVLFAFDEDGNVVLTNKNFIWGHLKINQKVDFNRLKEALNYCFRKNDTIRIKLFKENNKILQYFEDYEEQNFEIVDVDTNEETSLKEDSVIVTKKLAKYFNKKVGDTISILESDNLTYEFTISNICENYIGDYIYI